MNLQHKNGRHQTLCQHSLKGKVQLIFPNLEHPCKAENTTHVWEKDPSRKSIKHMGLDM